MRNYAGTCKGICSYNLVYNFLIQLLPLKSSVFVVHFSNAFWHGNEAFPKVSSQNEIVLLLVIFHLPYSKYRGVKICFLIVSLSKSKFFTLSHPCCNQTRSLFSVPILLNGYLWLNFSLKGKEVFKQLVFQVHRVE